MGNLMLKTVPAIILFLCASDIVHSRDYSAVALSQKTGAFGWGTDYATQREADRVAMEECRKHSSLPRDCRVEARFTHGCFAAAGGSRYTSIKTGKNAASAQREAIATCKKDSQGCRINQVTCTNVQRP
ncbi:DUF4189 domain-containing protein [Rhizobium sp. LCM 4573]|uniref:DUF4189 domain-containing protein n=1 Tax=Rhizobium sp. LCM 4573 TaxID=1848291 RepID=UPI0008DB10E7|nr:hypothetical protein LCM4573_12590 [Rhizobium sp. LCM 4573]